ncbi:uncharacterized protein [Palaemon carinicauda]|uniref:uncharacterized protein n=1 Tax=Palaemon carinicauda TaxID=392227 RepID=UPI0035B67612
MQLTEYDKPPSMSYIDYDEAFDPVKTSAVMTVPQRQGIKESYVRTLEDIYTGSTAIHKLHEHSEKIPIEEGVIKGYSISSKLFTSCLNEGFKNLDWENVGITINRKSLNNLRFTDDIIVFSESWKELRKMAEDLNRESRM